MENVEQIFDLKKGSVCEMVCIYTDMCNFFSQVIIGGGRKYMTPEGTQDPEYPLDSSSWGARRDGQNLIKEWQSMKTGKVALLITGDHT